MKNTFGQQVAVTLFGESHGPAIGAVIDGLAPGITIDPDDINRRLFLRRPFGTVSTARVEPDDWQIVSGAFGGRTTGTPLTIIIRNTDMRSRDYQDFRDIPRPSHADFTANEKYHGCQDYRGGGHFSGRLTAALVAAGAILGRALEQKGIFIGTHIAALHQIPDRPFGDIRADIRTLSATNFPVLDPSAADRMMRRIQEVAQEGDSVGGVLETAVIGLPAGVGEPWFDTLEGVLAHAIFSVPGVKGVAFGDGFDIAAHKGSEVNDAFTTDGRTVGTATNHSGGINGGISNGMPLLIRTAVKPTPSIFRPQSSVRLSDMTETELTVRGRHDPAIIHRARAVVDAVSAIALADLLTIRYGTDYLSEI